MSDNAVFEILKEIRADIAEMKSTLAALPRIQAEVSATARRVNMLQQDVRMVRGALNDMARTNVTSGEIEALHADVNQMRAEMREMEVRLDLLEKAGR